MNFAITQHFLPVAKGQIKIADAVRSIHASNLLVPFFILKFRPGSFDLFLDALD